MNTQRHSLFSDFDISLFKAGKHYRLYEKLGSHLITLADGTAGTYFAVWAPNARYVSVIGSFNSWHREANYLFPRPDGSGIWEGFVPNAKKGDLYKYFIHSNYHDLKLEKADPFCYYTEVPPQTASKIWDLHYDWKDQDWMHKRREEAGQPRPYSVYEVHLGSWRKHNGQSLTYRELATELVAYVKSMGFTHVEMMPPMQHPYQPSWGYQITGYFAADSRAGSPQDFMYLCDELHRAGIGILLDWVPSHFPEDPHGLALFDGTHLFEHADPRKGFHPDWKSCIFNYGRNEVRAFLISNALFWLDRYHADGLRVDAVASMLYLDYSRKEGEWIPNEFGGRENLEAISLFRELNETVYGLFPDVETIAEESTAFAGVSRPTYTGGLGFGQKWMMGWMHDTLNYFKNDPIHRRYHHGQLTFSLVYAFTENFMLPLSHDEVVHGKGSLIARMPGDEWRRFANLRLMFGYMWTHPGQQLLFMGGEWGQTTEWSLERGLDWWQTDKPMHIGTQRWVRDLNEYFKVTPAMWHFAYSPEGFEWIVIDDAENSVLVYLRKGTEEHAPQLVVCNFTPVVRSDYRVGVPLAGEWKEVLNSDASEYGGSGVVHSGVLNAHKTPSHKQPASLSLTLAPLGMSVFAPSNWKKSKSSSSKAKTTSPTTDKATSTKPKRTKAAK